MKQLDARYKGDVQAFVGSGAMNAVLDQMKAQFLEDFVATNAADTASMAALHSKVQALEDFRATLQNIAAG